MLAGDGSPYRERVLERLDLKKSSAQEALRNLISRAEVEATHPGYVPVDPLFALWIERLGSAPAPERARITMRPCAPGPRWAARCGVLGSRP